MKSLKYILVGLLILAGVASAYARLVGPDAKGYTATDDTTFSFVDIASTGTGVLSGADDDASAVSFGFPFRFYGRDFAGACISTNGTIALGGCYSDFANLDLTSTKPPGDLPLIAPFWTDLTFDAPGAGSVYYQTLGTAPFRRFVVQWSNAFPVNASKGISFQVILAETNNTILFQYKDVDVGMGSPASFGAQATVGIRDTDAVGQNRRVQWSFNAPTLHNDEAILFTSDSTPPVISPLITGTQGLNGWYTSNVSLHWNVSDPESGIQSTQQCSDVTLSSDSAGTPFQCSTINNVGLSSAASTTIKIDKAAPVVSPPSSISISATQSGGATAANSPMLATFLVGGSATDALDPSPLRLSDQVGGVDSNASTLFSLGTTPVTFRSRDAAGNIGSAIANVTVSLGQPRLSMTISSKGGGSPGNYYIDVRFTNTGTGIARNLAAAQLPLKTLSGTGTVSLVTPALPIVVGNLDPGASIDVRIYLNRPSTVTRFSVTENGTVQDATGATSSYSAAQTVIP